MPLKEKATGATTLISWLRSSGVWLRPIHTSTSGANRGLPATLPAPTAFPFQYSLMPLDGSNVATRWFQA